MEEASDTIDPLFADKVRRARAMSPQDKLRAGGLLFEYTRKIVIAGIRHQNPDATEAEIGELFHQRLQLARQLERS